MKRFTLLLALGTALSGSAMAQKPAQTSAAKLPAGPVRMVDYTFKARDTLFELWRDYLTGPHAAAQVAKLNHIRDVRRIPTGKLLHIPRSLLRDEAAQARIETFSGPVTIRIGQQANPAKAGDAVGEGARVETGRNAFVALRLGDGSVIALPSQSSLTISWLRKVKLNGALEREVRLDGGRLRTKVTPMGNPDSHFRVVTPIAVSAVRGTEFRVAYEGGEDFSATQVDDGKVGFAEQKAGFAENAAGAADRAALELAPGFGAAKAHGQSTGVIKLLPAPKLDQPDKVQSEEQLHFAIQPLPEAARYHVQIAKDAGFVEVIDEVIGGGIGGAIGGAPVFTLNSIPADSYFVRVSAYDKLGLEGTAGTYTFERRRNLVKGSAEASPPGVRRLRFRWDGTADGKPQYRFQMVRSGAPDVPVVDETGLSSNVLSVSNLPAGDYSWRVCSMLLVKGKLVATWTAPQSIHVGK